MNSDENDLPKILILGSYSHGKHVTEYSWNAIPETLNIADYQILIMDFTVLNNPEFLESVTIKNNMSEYQFGKFLFSPNSEVVVIGPGKFLFPYIGSRGRPSTYWLPKAPAFDYDSGNTVNIVDTSFEYYLKNVESWSFCLRPDGWDNHPQLPAYLNEAGVGHNNAGVQITPLAENRYKRPIAFAVVFDVGPYQSGPVIWLSAPTKISTHEAIDLLLKERYKVFSEVNPPDWLVKFPLPKEIPLRAKIAHKQEEIKKFSDQIEELEQNLREETKYHQLLYESGEGVLEPIVRNALRELGAHVDDPKVKGRDDGRLTDPRGREATLEIKGREGQLKLRDINELDRWVRDSLVMEDRRSKGILIGNLKRDQPLDNRADIYPPNCLQAAKNSDMSLLTTSQIYRAIQDKQNGKFNQDEFWDAVFSANGDCDLPHPKET